MNCHFHKMHGAGNDFILIDDRGLDFPCTPELIRRLCDRHDGIGSDGLILLHPSPSTQFAMRFFNPDGHEADTCGNGARCAARLARRIGLAPDSMRFDTHAGVMLADIGEHGNVTLQLPPPHSTALQLRLPVGDRVMTGHAINTGVPHVVLETDDLDHCPVHELGRALRHHPHFAPHGTNVDFILVTGPSQLRIRTYERGVEAETPACGTGIVASAVIAGLLGKVTSPVSVFCAHGDTLTVAFDTPALGIGDVRLQGPTAFVFEGTLDV